jgi:hypothetical protein
VRCSRRQPALPTHPLDRATLVPSPTSLIADLDTLIARRAPPTQTLARYKSRALLAFEYHAVSKRGALCPPLTTHLLKLNPVIACSDWESVSSVHRRLRESRAASDTRLRHHLPVGWCCWARESYRDRADHFGFRCSVQMLPATSVDCSETGLAPFPRRSMKPAEPQPRALNASSFLLLSTPRPPRSTLVLDARSDVPAMEHRPERARSCAWGLLAFITVDHQMIDAIEKWRGKQRPIPNASEAIRKLVEIGLASAHRAVLRTKKATDASEMAGQEN